MLRGSKLSRSHVLGWKEMTLIKVAVFDSIAMTIHYSYH